MDNNQNLVQASRMDIRIFRFKFLKASRAEYAEGAEKA